MYNYNSTHKKIIVDTITPVSIYLKLRDQFSNTILLESSDYIAKDNSYAYICCNPIAKFFVKKNILYTQFPDKSCEEKKLNPNSNIFSELTGFMEKFNIQKLVVYATNLYEKNTSRTLFFALEDSRWSNRGLEY